MKKKSFFWLILIMLMAAAALTWAYFFKDKESQTRYRTAKVERGSLSTFVTANGTVNPVINIWDCGK